MSKTAVKEVAQEIEWDVIDGENTDFAVQYPRLQWVHGSKQAAGFNKTGGLFIAKEQYPNFPGDGFEPTTLITRDGTEIEGYAATRTLIAVIRVKHQWVKDENYGRNIPLAHVLCAIQGCEDLLVISLRGASKALEFQKAFNLHQSQVVSVANRTRPEGMKALEPFALWFILQAGQLVSITSKDGKSSSIVTPFELNVPETVNREYAVGLWVGKDNYKQFAAFWKDTAAWQKAPIWEQRSEDDHTSDVPAYTGGDADPITEQQAQELFQLANIKSVNLAEYMLEYTNGGSNAVENLSRGEAREFINRIAAM